MLHDGGRKSVKVSPFEYCERRSRCCLVTHLVLTCILWRIMGLSLWPFSSSKPNHCLVPAQGLHPSEDVAFVARVLVGGRTDFLTASIRTDLKHTGWVTALRCDWSPQGLAPGFGWSWWSFPTSNQTVTFPQAPLDVYYCNLDSRGLGLVPL